MRNVVHPLAAASAVIHPIRKSYSSRELPGLVGSDRQSPPPHAFFRSALCRGRKAIISRGVSESAIHGKGAVLPDISNRSTTLAMNTCGDTPQVRHRPAASSQFASQTSAVQNPVSYAMRCNNNASSGAPASPGEGGSATSSEASRVKAKGSSLPPTRRMSAFTVVDGGRSAVNDGRYFRRGSAPTPWDFFGHGKERPLGEG